MYILEPVRLVQKEGQPFGLFFFLGYTVGRAAQLFGLKYLGTVKPPLRNSPLCSAFTPHLQRGLEAVLETVHPFHVGAKFSLLRRFFYVHAQKSIIRRHPHVPLPLRSKTRPACAGLRFGFGYQSERCGIWVLRKPKRRTRLPRVLLSAFHPGRNDLCDVPYALQRAAQIMFLNDV